MELARPAMVTDLGEDSEFIVLLSTCHFHELLVNLRGLWQGRLCKFILCGKLCLGAYRERNSAVYRTCVHGNGDTQVQMVYLPLADAYKQDNEIGWEDHAHTYR